MAKISLGCLTLACGLSAMLGCSQQQVEQSTIPITSAQKLKTELAVSPFGNVGPSEKQDSILTVAVTTNYILNSFVRYWQPSTEYVAVAVADFNGDARRDIVALREHGEVHIYYQNKHGGLDGPGGVIFSRDKQSYNELLIADFDGNGLPEVATPAMNLPYRQAGSIYHIRALADGGIGFDASFAQEMDATHGWRALDIDGDGHLDIVGLQNVTDESNGSECGPSRGYGSTCPRLKIMYGDGQGGFARIETLKLGLSYALDKIEVVDLDRDGFLDLALVLVPQDVVEGALMIMRRLPEGGLDLPQYLHAAYGFSSGGDIRFGDFNGDGHLDTAQTSAVTHAVQLRLGTVEGGFQEAVSLPTLRPLPVAMLVADFDGDSKDDLVVLERAPWAQDEWGEPLLGLYLQRNGYLTLHARLPLVELPYQIRTAGLAAGDVNGDGCTDLVVAAGREGVLVYYGSNCVPPRRVIQDDSGLVWRTPLVPASALSKVQAPLPAPIPRLSTLRGQEQQR